MDKRFWVIMGVVAVILGGLLLAKNGGDAGGSTTGKDALTNHVKGQGSSGVTLTEYGDFSCPACAQYYPILKAVANKYNEEITFQFRHFPLFQIPGHENAIAAARAAEAASQQGKFWEMHDLIYENQESWRATKDPLTVFTSYAKQLGLDTTKFATDYKSRQANDKIQADLREGNRLGVTGTPTFFIDGKKISSPDSSVEAFSKVLDAAIKQKTGKAPAASEQPAAEPAQDTPTPAPAE